MKILIICGCMEPGRDGVGDYTRYLSHGLIVKGHNVKVLALKDRYVPKIQSENQDFLGSSVPVIRIPVLVDVKKGMRAAASFLNDFQPNWISLQFVPYAYSSLGMPLSLPNALASFYPKVPKHLLFHETYIGGELNLKNKLVQIAQIYVIRKLASQSGSGLVQTTNKLYKQILEQIGISASVLGLIGNIPISGHRVEGRINAPEGFTAVYFGVSPKPANYASIAKKIGDFLNGSTHHLRLIFCGKAGLDRNQFIDSIVSACPPDRLEVRDLGMLTAHELSELFLSSDFGIARVDASLLGKSGTSIAMLEHGLPLFVPLAESRLEIESNFDFRTNQCFSELSETIAHLNQYDAESRLGEIVDLMLGYFEDSKQHL